MALGAVALAGKGCASRKMAGAAGGLLRFGYLVNSGPVIQGSGGGLREKFVVASLTITFDPLVMSLVIECHIAVLRFEDKLLRPVMGSQLEQAEAIEKDDRNQGCDESHTDLLLLYGPVARFAGFAVR
jgi:hypothetical protein